MHRPKLVLVSAFSDECEMYAEYFQLAGFHVLIRDPAAALAQLRADAPDVIVTRIRQPGAPIDGISLTRAIKSERREVIVIVITTSMAAQDRIDATAAGCELYLVLPVGPEELVEHTRELLGARSYPPADVDM